MRGVSYSILWQLYKSIFTVYTVYIYNTIPYIVCMIGGIFSIACALYVRNVLKLTRETPHKQLPHGAYARCVGVCVCLGAWLNWLNLIAVWQHWRLPSVLTSVGNLANGVHFKAFCNTVVHISNIANAISQAQKAANLPLGSSSKGEGRVREREF